MRRIALGIAVAFISTWAPSGATGSCPQPWPDWGPTANDPTALFYLNQIRDIAAAHLLDLSCPPQSTCAAQWDAVKNVEPLWRQDHAQGCDDPKLASHATAYPFVKAAWTAATRGRVLVPSVGADASVLALSNFTAAANSFSQFAQGTWVVTNGFTTLANNGVWQVHSVSPDGATLTVHDGGNVIQTEASENVQEVWFVAVPMPVLKVTPASSAAGSATGLSEFHRQTGSFTNDGFVVGLFVRVRNFQPAAVNARKWEIVDITNNGATLVVRDAGNLIINNGFAAAREIIYDPPLACFDTLDHQD